MVKLYESNLPKNLSLRFFAIVSISIILASMGSPSPVNAIPEAPNVGFELVKTAAYLLDQERRNRERKAGGPLVILKDTITNPVFAIVLVVVGVLRPDMLIRPIKSTFNFFKHWFIQPVTEHEIHRRLGEAYDTLPPGAVSSIHQWIASRYRWQIGAASAAFMGVGAVAAISINKLIKTNARMNKRKLYRELAVKLVTENSYKSNTGQSVTLDSLTPYDRSMVVFNMRQNTIASLNDQITQMADMLESRGILDD